MGIRGRVVPRAPARRAAAHVDDATPTAAGRPRRIGVGLVWKSAARSGWLLVLTPALCMAVVGLWGLDRGGIWRDEAVTMEVALRSPGQIWTMLGSVDAVHGLYYFLMHGVLSLDHSEVMLRLPSVVASTVTAGVVAALGRRLSGPVVGLWAGLIYAGTPMVSRYAQEGRSYALVACAATTATLLLLRVVEAPTPRRWCAYGAALLCSMVLHEFAVLLLCAHAASLLLTRAPRRRLRAWGATAGVACLLVSPLVMLSQRQAAQVTWIPRPGGHDVWFLLRSFAGGGSVRVVVVVLLALLAVRDPRPGARRLVQWALPLAVIPPTILLMVSQLDALYVPRYVLFSLVGVPLLMAQGLDSLTRAVRAAAPSWRVPVAGVGAGVIALGFTAQLGQQREERRPSSRADDVTVVARALAHLDARRDAGVLFLPTSARVSALAYPDSVSGMQDVSLGVTGAQRGNLYGDGVGPRVLRHRLGTLRCVWVVRQRHLPWSPQDVQSVREVDDLFRAADSTTVRTTRITRYVRR